MTTKDSWNPEQYAKFKAERSRPFHDLLELVRPAPGGRAADLGCGTGELTRIFHERVKAKETLGLDSSEAMLTEAVKFASEGLQFRKSDIRELPTDARYDLVFSNAALQWIPDHEALLPRIRKALKDHGQLAVQIPANFDHPSHTIAAEVAAEEFFKRHLTDGPALSPKSVLNPERYAEILYALGFREQHVRLQVYPHELPSSVSVVEWVRGSCLTAYQSRFSATIWPQFLKEYQKRLIERIGDRSPYFYAFKRILFWGRLG